MDNTMLFFKLTTNIFEFLIINEWKLPNRNPLNLSVITFDLLYKVSFCMNTMRRIESTGFKIGIFGILFVFFFNVKKEMDDESKKKLIIELGKLKQLKHAN